MSNVISVSDHPDRNDRNAMSFFEREQELIQIAVKEELQRQEKQKPKFAYVMVRQDWKGFGRFYDSVLKSTRMPMWSRVLNWLMHNIDYGNTIMVSNKVIAEDLDVSTKSVQRAVDALAKMNIIGIDRQNGGYNIYSLNSDWCQKGGREQVSRRCKTYGTIIYDKQ